MSVISGSLFLSQFLPTAIRTWPRAWRRHQLRHETAIDDLLAALFRLQEAGIDHADPKALGTRSMFDPTARAPRGTTQAVDHYDVGHLTLTKRGHERARRQVRRHRQWETYPATEAGVAEGRVHHHAEEFEHLPIEPGGHATTDPHGRPIPEDRYWQEPIGSLKRS